MVIVFLKGIYMDLNTFLEQSWIPILMCVICFYYAWRLLVKKDISCIRTKQMKPIKRKFQDEYCIRAGHIFLYYAFAVVLNIFLSFFQVYIALAEIILATIIMFYCWKKLKDSYE